MDINSYLYPRSSILSLRSCISWAATVSGSLEWAGDIKSQPKDSSVTVKIRKNLFKWWTLLMPIISNYSIRNKHITKKGAKLMAPLVVGLIT
jgi:hypothetical protein